MFVLLTIDQYLLFYMFETIDLPIGIQNLMLVKSTLCFILRNYVPDRIAVQMSSPYLTWHVLVDLSYQPVNLQKVRAL